MDCTTFTKCKPVGRCGTRIWLGKNTSLTGNELLFIKYYLGNEEVIESVDPIIVGNDVFLDLTTPYIDFFNEYISSYFVWLSDAYLSDYKQLTNSSTLHDGLILTFNGSTYQDIAIPC